MSAPIFFRTPGELREWFVANHLSAAELIVGYYRKSAAQRGITWPESVEQALCFGWIDGVRRGINESSYSNRFTPRRRGSTWSAVNLRKVAELTAAGLMQPEGLRVHAERNPRRSGYSYESRSVELDSDLEARLRAEPEAWEFHSRQPPGYRRLTHAWIMSARQVPTRERRLQRVIDAALAGERLDLGTSPSRRAGT